MIRALFARQASRPNVAFEVRDISTLSRDGSVKDWAEPDSELAIPERRGRIVTARLCPGAEEAGDANA